MTSPASAKSSAAIMQISTSVYTVGKYGSSYLKGVKCALSLLGVCDDYLSYPYRKFRTEERARIRRHSKRWAPTATYNP